jgi:nucleoside-triphosphatase THEP1
LAGGPGEGQWKKLYCFLMVLAYSRMRYIEFATDMSTSTLIRCHQNAFRYFGGYPEEILYDNMRQVVIKRLLNPHPSQSADCPGTPGRRTARSTIVFLGPPGVGKTHLATALGMVAASQRFSTYYVSCQQLIEQLKKAHFENHLPERLRLLTKYRLLIIDEIGYLPMDIQGVNLFFQLIARRYEKSSTIFTSN